MPPPVKPPPDDSVVTAADVRALVDTDLSTPDLETVIDREEAYLHRIIGYLQGERTQTVYPEVHPETASMPIYLVRPTDAVFVQEAGVDLGADGFTLYPVRGIVVREPRGSWWTGPVSLTFTPNDLLEVQRVIIELVRLTVTETGYLSETIGDYSYSRGARGGSLNPTEAARKKLADTLLRHLPASTSRLATDRRWIAPWPQANWNDPYA